MFIFEIQLNFHYTRFITPMRVMSLRDPSPRHCAAATRLLSKKYRSGGEPLIGNTVFDLTSPRFEAQICCFVVLPGCFRGMAASYVQRGHKRITYSTEVQLT